MLITACESRWTKTTVALTLERLHCLKINLSGDERKKKRKRMRSDILRPLQEHFMHRADKKRKKEKRNILAKCFVTKGQTCWLMGNFPQNGTFFFDARQLELKISTLLGASSGGEKEPTHVVVTSYATIDLLCWSSLEELLLTHQRKSNDVQVLIVEA